MTRQDKTRASTRRVGGAATASDGAREDQVAGEGRWAAWYRAPSAKRQRAQSAGWTVLGQRREQRAGNPATAAVGGQITVARHPGDAGAGQITPSGGTT